MSYASTGTLGQLSFSQLGWLEATGTGYQLRRADGLVIRLSFDEADGAYPTPAFTLNYHLDAGSYVGMYARISGPSWQEGAQWWQAVQGYMLESYAVEPDQPVPTDPTTTTTTTTPTADDPEMSEPDPATANGDETETTGDDAPTDTEANGNGAEYDDTNGRGETNGREAGDNVIYFPTNGATDGNGAAPADSPTQAGFQLNGKTLLLAAAAAFLFLPFFDRGRERAI